MSISSLQHTELGSSIRRHELCPDKKVGACVGKTKRGKVTKWMVVVESQGVPIGSNLASASPSEVTLLDKTFETVSAPRPSRGRPRENPKRIIADKAYDSDPLIARLNKRGIELVAPYRQNKRNRVYYEGRKIRR